MKPELSMQDVADSAKRMMELDKDGDIPNHFVMPMENALGIIIAPLDSGSLGEKTIIALAVNRIVQMHEVNEYFHVGLAWMVTRPFDPDKPISETTDGVIPSQDPDRIESLIVTKHKQGSEDQLQTFKILRAPGLLAIVPLDAKPGKLEAVYSTWNVFKRRDELNNMWNKMPQALREKIERMIEQITQRRN